MVPLRLIPGPELLFVLLCFAVVSVPLFVGAVAFANRATGGGRDEELAELRRRVTELERRTEDADADRERRTRTRADPACGSGE